MNVPERAVQPEQYDVEREKLAVEREKLAVERYKAKWTAIGSILPLIAAIATLGYSIWSLRETAVTQFETKVAELAMAAPGPSETRNRARVLVAMFGDLLPKVLTGVQF